MSPPDDRAVRSRRKRAHRASWTPNTPQRRHQAGRRRGAQSRLQRIAVGPGGAAQRRFQVLSIGVGVFGDGALRFLLAGSSGRPQYSRRRDESTETCFKQVGAVNTETRIPAGTAP